jgi:hypothetical protein
MIMNCTCEHEYQDAHYGTGRRVHNPLRPAAGKPPEYRCTVCATVRVGPAAAKATKGGGA